MYGSVRGKVLLAACIAVLLLSQSTDSILATTTTSPNYQATEAEFGAGAAIDSCSGSYCANATIGAIGGESSSQNFTASFTDVGDDKEPLLELMIEPGKSDLGKLDLDRTATRTMMLHVRSHFAGGYTVQVIGKAPSFEDYSLATPLEPSASLKGTEQFALNMVSNSDPQVGDAPKIIDKNEERPIADVIQPKYASPNLFSYSNGEIVAKTYMESSRIRYTVSMIVNVSGTTPAGHYSGDFSAIVTPVF